MQGRNQNRLKKSAKNPKIKKVKFFGHNKLVYILIPRSLKLQRKQWTTTLKKTLAWFKIILVFETLFRPRSWISAKKSEGKSGFFEKSLISRGCISVASGRFGMSRHSRSISWLQFVDLCGFWPSTTRANHRNPQYKNWFWWKIAFTTPPLGCRGSLAVRLSGLPSP